MIQAFYALGYSLAGIYIAFSHEDVFMSAFTHGLYGIAITAIAAAADAIIILMYEIYFTIMYLRAPESNF